MAEPVGDRLGRGSVGASRTAVDEQVVGGDVEGLGEADDGLDGGRDAAVGA